MVNSGQKLTKIVEPALQPPIIDLELELPAAPEDVWAALTQPEHLSAWLATDVEAGAEEGASVVLSWTDEVVWQTHIALWRELRHLRWLDEQNEVLNRRVMTDFFVQPADNNARLRLVQSGFDEGPDGAEFVEAIAAGWDYYLAHLRHYVRHHFGTRREMIYARQPFSGGRSEIWRAILDPDSGLVLADAVGLQVGQELNITLDDRSPLSGMVESLVPERTIGIRLPEMNEALLLVEIEAGMVDCRCGFWLSLYGWEQEDDLALALRDKVDALKLAN